MKVEVGQIWKYNNTEYMVVNIDYNKFVAYFNSDLYMSLNSKTFEPDYPPFIFIRKVKYCNKCKFK